MSNFALNSVNQAISVDMKFLKGVQANLGSESEAVASQNLISSPSTMETSIWNPNSPLMRLLNSNASQNNASGGWLA